MLREHHEMGIAERLELVERELLVRRLIDRYADACDHDDAAGVVALFSVDGTLVVRGAAYVGDEIATFYRGRLELRSLHFTSGLRLSEGPEGLIRSTCGFIAVEMPETGSALVAGRYDDVVRIERGEGLFATREITIFGRTPLGG